MALAQLLAVSVFMLPTVTPPMAAARGQQQQAAADAQPEAPVMDEETLNGKTFTVSRILVHAKPEKVWGIITDYNNAPKVFSQLKKCQIVEDKGSTKILKHQVMPGGLAACSTYQYTIEVKENAPKSLEWHRISGDFKAVDGFWRLEPANGGHDTLVTYSAYVNGGLFIPQMLIKRQFRVDMPVVLNNLKGESEGGIRIAKKADSSRVQ